TPGPDAGENPLEVADAACQRLHFPKPSLHRLEPLTDQRERLAEPALERLVELLVHGRADFLETRRNPGREPFELRQLGLAQLTDELELGVGRSLADGGYLFPQRLGLAGLLGPQL